MVSDSASRPSLTSLPGGGRPGSTWQLRTAASSRKSTAGSFGSLQTVGGFSFRSIGRMIPNSYECRLHLSSWPWARSSRYSRRLGAATLTLLIGHDERPLDRRPSRRRSARPQETDRCRAIERAASREGPHVGTVLASPLRRRPTSLIRTSRWRHGRQQRRSLLGSANEHLRREQDG
jgi:hypothetical protein